MYGDYLDVNEKIKIISNNGFEKQKSKRIVKELG